MKKIAVMMLVAGMLASVNTFATDGGKKCKKNDKCTEKSCCKKPAKAAMLKAKPKAAVKKVA